VDHVCNACISGDDLVTQPTLRHSAWRDRLATDVGSLERRIRRIYTALQNHHLHHLISTFHKSKHLPNWVSLAGGGTQLVSRYRNSTSIDDAQIHSSPGCRGVVVLCRRGLGGWGEMASEAPHCLCSKVRVRCYHDAILLYDRNFRGLPAASEQASVGGDEGRC
jgi:hypothetical protein